MSYRYNAPYDEYDNYSQIEYAQPPTQPAPYYNHNTQVEPLQAPPNPTPYTHLKLAATQLGFTPTELTTIEEECIRDQTKWLTIERRPTGKFTETESLETTKKRPVE